MKQSNILKNIDDQFYNSLLVTYHPELFTVYYTSWYNKLKLRLLLYLLSNNVSYL